ncbi:MAG: FtsX-like permease family protein [SAR324 cluster bacterium]|nr:FtsX-like permease family protein [SAR324 cluster bacterium]
MRIESLIGLRLLRAKRRDHTVSVVTWISMVGVMLGVTALIVTISVMNGFRENLFIALSGTTPHLRILPLEGNLSAEAREALDARLAQYPDLRATGPYLARQAFIAAGEEFRAVILRGIDPAREGGITELARFLRGAVLLREDGELAREQTPAAVLAALAYPPPAGQRAGIVLGGSLARSLGLLVGDQVRLISTVQRMTPIGPVPLMKQFRLVGTFDTGLSGTDDILAFADYRVAQRLFRMGGSLDGLAVRMADAQRMDVAGLRAILPGYRVLPWTEEHKNIFQVMRLEKLGLFLILALIIVVSFFNIISSLIMLVLEKRKAIAILKTLGARDSMVRRIFFMQGIWIGTLGTCGGLGLGLAICWVLATFDLIRFPEGVFPLSSRLPVLVNWVDLLIITASSFAICMLVTLYPATRAARVDPVENLRYE